MDQSLFEINELKNRVARLEEIVIRLTGQPLPSLHANRSQLDQELRSMISQGQMLNAIKVYREHTNCSLNEAKNYVEALTRG